MAGRKRKANTALASSQRNGPSTEIVEVSSDPPEKVFKKGAARGLNEGNVLTPPLTQPSVEQNDDEDGKFAVKTSHHMTRGARNGRPDDRLKYDMKFHPMDDVTNPKRAARRRGSRSVSASALRIEDETSDESLPSSADESEDDDCRASDGSSSGSDIETLLPKRIQDPRSTRHSTRAVANKTVYYSRKHHPQDYALPGHQKKAKRLRRLQRRCGNAHGKPTSEEGKGSSSASDDTDGTVIDDSESDEEVAPGSGSNLRSKPRQHLRSLSTKGSSSPKKSAEDDESELVGPDDLLDMMPDSGMGAYTEKSRGDTGESADDSDGAAYSLNGVVDNARASSSSARQISDYVAAKHSRSLAGPNMFASDTERDPSEDAVSTQSRRREQIGKSEAGEDDAQSELLEDHENDQDKETDDVEASSTRDEGEKSKQGPRDRRPSQDLADGKSIQRESYAVLEAQQGRNSVGSAAPSSVESPSAGTDE